MTATTPTPASTGTGTWWQQAGAAALLGTARREPPDLPAELGITARPDATPETLLLDSAAVGGALLRAGARAGTPAIEPVAGAAPETMSAAPARAAQLLTLLLDQPPVAARLRPLALQHWLDAAAALGVRAPHALLPRLLDLGVQQAELRAAVRPVLGERGRWLGGLRADWSWAVDAEPTDEPRDEATRDHEGLTNDAWRALPAGDRLARLEELAPPFTAPTLALLESALDDRSEKVRRQAYLLLDTAPESERAQRMAARLRALVSSAGRLRRTLQVELPTQPDAAGVRDGLTTTRAGSQRERWLELISAGAPLSVWTEVSGKDPAHTWPLITQPAARAGVLRAIRARRDLAWAGVAVPEAPDLLAVLPPQDRDAAARQLLRGDRSVVGASAVIRHVPAPWGAELSAEIVDTLRRTGPAAGSTSLWLPLLAAGLHPSVRPALSAWARAGDRWGSTPADLDQFLSFLPAITEAFR